MSTKFHKKIDSGCQIEFSLTYGTKPTNLSWTYADSLGNSLSGTAVQPLTKYTFNPHDDDLKEVKATVQALSDGDHSVTIHLEINIPTNSPYVGGQASYTDSNVIVKEACRFIAKPDTPTYLEQLYKLDNLKGSMQYQPARR